MQEKDILLKGVCCLMLLQINGEAKGETHVQSSQKQLTHSEGPFLFEKPRQEFKMEAMPAKSEIQLESVPDMFIKKGKIYPAPRNKKFSVGAEIRPFITRKMPVSSVTKQNKGHIKSISQNKKSGSFQWTRVATRNDRRVQINRSVANRLCNDG